MLFVLVPLILACFFGVLGVAALLYPMSYDWRYNTISQLLYPRNNPELHLLASISIAVSGLLMIPFAGYIGRRLRRAAPAAATVGTVLFFAGCIFLILAGLVTSHPAQGTPRLPRLHEILARLSGIGIGVGIVVFNACETKGYFRPNPEKTIRPRSLVVSWNLLTVPVILVLVTWLVVRTWLKRAGPTHHALVTSAAGHLGFWEWIGAAVIFLFLVCAALFLPKNNPE